MSRKQKRMENLRAAKDKRMKKVAVGGAVLLVAVLAFEVGPHVFGGSKSAAPASTTTTTAATGAPSTTAPATAPTATPPGTPVAAGAPTTASTKLPNSDVAPAHSKSQLYSFSNFSGKNPFIQQVSATTGSTSGTSTSGSSGSSGSSSSTQSNNVTQAASVTHQSTGKSESRALAKVGAATISVNGTRQTVQVGASFPSSNPLFRLVSVSHGVVRVGIASGSYASGAPTVSLVTGRTMTLVDTADGVHYQLRLLSLG
jgi:hypothetical protein